SAPATNSALSNASVAATAASRRSPQPAQRSRQSMPPATRKPPKTFDNLGVSEFRRFRQEPPAVIVHFLTYERAYASRGQGGQGCTQHHFSAPQAILCRALRKPRCRHG